MLSFKRQSARMSKITNGGLTWSGTGFAEIATVGVKGLKTFGASATPIKSYATP